MKNMRNYILIIILTSLAVLNVSCRNKENSQSDKKEKEFQEGINNLSKIDNISQFIDKNKTFHLRGTSTYLIFIPNNKYGGKANVVWASSAGNSFTYDIKGDGSIHLHDGRNMFYSRYKESYSDIVLQYDKNNQFLFYISGGEIYIYRVTQKKLFDHFYY